MVCHSHCGDVRSRTSYNTNLVDNLRDFVNCGDVRSRTSYNMDCMPAFKDSEIVVTSDLGRVTTPELNRQVMV